MSLTSGFVLFAVIWFMAFLVILPLRLTTQGEAGDVVPGTPKSAPADAQIGRRARLATWWALGLWAVAAGVILSGSLSVADLDWFGRLDR